MAVGKILHQHEVDARIVDVLSQKIVSSCGVQLASAIRGVGDALNYFSSLTGATVQQYLIQTKERTIVAGCYDI